MLGPDRIHEKKIKNGRLRFNVTLADAILSKNKVNPNDFNFRRYPIQHELIDKVIRCKETDEFFVVSRVFMIYDEGHYMVALYENPCGSTGQVNVGNVSSMVEYAESQMHAYDITDMSLDEFFGTHCRKFYDNRKKNIEPDIARFAAISEIIR